MEKYLLKDHEVLQHDEPYVPNVKLPSWEEIRTLKSVQCARRTIPDPPNVLTPSPSMNATVLSAEKNVTGNAETFTVQSDSDTSSTICSYGYGDGDGELELKLFITKMYKLCKCFAFVFIIRVQGPTQK